MEWNKIDDKLIYIFFLTIHIKCLFDKKEY